MVTIQELVNSSLLLALVCGGLGYIVLFSVVCLVNARKLALKLCIIKGG